MQLEQAPGFFGKVPAVGDFVSRRLPRSFLDPWDQWLQSAIAYSQEQLAETWLDLYLSSPIWRFALSADVAGPLPCGGVLMPSVDKAGRYFPFTLVTFLPTTANIFQIASHSQGWFEAAEAVALNVLEETAPDIELMDKQIVALGLLTSSNTLDSNNSTNIDQQRQNRPWHITMQSVDGLSAVLPMLLRRLSVDPCFLTEEVKRITDFQYGTYSLWWSDGSEHIDPGMLMSNRLPPPTGFSAMLEGNWMKYGWDDLKIMPSLSESGTGNVAKK